VALPTISRIERTGIGAFSIMTSNYFGSTSSPPLTKDYGLPNRPSDATGDRDLAVLD
jgi:hypothetical protein